MSRPLTERVQRRLGYGNAGRVLRGLRQQPIVMLALVYLIVLMLAALFAPQIAPHDPLKQDLMTTLQGPSATYPLGTDHLGRDMFSRVLYGAQASLLAAFQGVGIAVVLGVTLGLLAGYFGGWLDRALMWFVDVIYALPLLLVAMGLIAIIGTGLANAMLAVGLALSNTFIRLTRGLVLAEREELYIAAAQVGGIRRVSIIFRHLLPNVLPALIVQSALTFGIVILIESSLSFLGLGVEVGDPSWGMMLSEARLYVRVQPFLPVPPGMAITLTVLAFNLLGDGLRDAFAPGRLAASRQRPKASAPTPVSAPNPEALLSVRDLDVSFPGEQEPVRVLRDVRFDIRPGEAFGIVGESGSGKTMTTAAILGMLPQNGVITGGSVRFDGAELVGLGEKRFQHIRGDEIGMIFQEPVTSLNPTLRIGDQIAEVLELHKGMSRAQGRKRAIELLDVVGIQDPHTLLDQYPHQLSGGMAQRVAIARALAPEPRLLIADEPTTALDVSIQAQILNLLDDLRREFNMAILLISHDLGAIARLCDRVAVMYAGEIVEQAPTAELFRQPMHPYTRDLLATMPQMHQREESLPVIPGTVPPMHNLPLGCPYHPRCALATDACRREPIALQQPVTNRESRCIHIDTLLKAGESEASDHA